MPIRISSDGSPRSRRPSICGSAAPIAACRRIRSSGCRPARFSSTAMSPISWCTPISTASRCCSTPSMSLRVEHVIVCGHYGCGGVTAANQGAPLGLIDNWLRHIQDAAERHRLLISGESDPADRLDRLCEINVLEQAHNVCRTTLVQDAWNRGQQLVVHAWIYRLSDGLLQDLGFSVSAAEQTARHFSTRSSVLRNVLRPCRTARGGRARIWKRETRSKF